MTHPNFVTNGASLEDCHTNFFALADLCGLKWRRYCDDSVLCYNPLDDPVLSSFSKCLAADILCVWRRVASPIHDHHRHNLQQDGNQLNYKKELWIFWYRKEPDLTGLISSALNGDDEKGSWENGLSYECRTLLFKALHNLIERSLIQRGFSRVGGWFVQPYDGKDQDTRNSQLTFSFRFFVHGESTVCTSIDVRQRPAVSRLLDKHLSMAQAVQSGLKVILSPFGLSGTLTGQSYKGADLATQKLLDDWHQFYPIRSRYVKDYRPEDDAPPVVEVIVSGIKMRYPSCYVLVAEIDEAATIRETAVNPYFSETLSSSVGFPPQPPPPPTSAPTPHPHHHHNHHSSSAAQQRFASSSVLTPPTSPCDPSMLSSLHVNFKHSAMNSELMYAEHFHSAASEQFSQTSCRVKEGSWQDSGLLGAVQTGDSASATAEGSAEQSQGLWDFGDPSASYECRCSRCKEKSKTNTTAASTTVTSKTVDTSCTNVNSTSTSSPSVSTSTVSASTTVATTSSVTPSSVAARKSDKPERTKVPHKFKGSVPFHKRNPYSDSVVDIEAFMQQTLNISASPGTPVLSNCGVNFQFKGPNQSLRAATPIGLPQLHTSVVQPSSLGSPLPGTPLMDGLNSQSSSTEPSMPTLSPHPPLPKEESAAPQLESQESQPMAQSPAVVPDTSSETAPEEKPSTELLPSPFQSNLPSVPESINIKSEESPSSQLPSCQHSQQQQQSQQQQSQQQQQLQQSQQQDIKPNVAELAVQPPPPPPATAAATPTTNTAATEAPPPVAQQPHHGLKRPSLVVQSRDDLRDELIMEGLLYDYSYLSSTVWENAPGKRRRLRVQISCSAELDDVMGDGYCRGNQDPSQVDDALLKTKDPYEFNDEFDEDSPSSSNFRAKIDEEEKTKESGLPPTPESQPPVNSAAAPLTPTNDAPKPPPTEEQQSVASPVSPKNQTSSFTSEKDLQVTDRDLENIFDTSSSDDSADDLFQTPSTPTSTKLCGTPDDGSTKCKNSLCTTGIVGVAELTRMFPTPPSLDNNTASSPAGPLCGSDMLSLEGERLELDGGCSPYYEPVKDWSYVYKLPVQQRFLGSQRYAPLPSIPSNPPLSAEYTYKPSWQVSQQATTNSVPCTVAPATSTNTQYSTGQPERMVQPPSSQYPILPVTEAGDRGVPPMYGMDPSSSSSDQRNMSLMYDMQSPASNASSYLNKHLNSMDSGSTALPVSEAHSLLVNLVISDSMLNIFKDHNFASCTLCVCNMNTKGADAGIYLPNNLIPSGNDEPQYKCTCGFSAVVNRHQSHRAGLFYEDELDITGHHYESLIHRKSLLSVEGNIKKIVAMEGTMGFENLAAQVDHIPHTIIDLIKVQCSQLYSSFSLFHKAENLRQLSKLMMHYNALELSDGCEVCFLALDTGKQAIDNMNNNRIDESLKSSCLHKWPYLSAKVPASNFEVVRLLRSLQPMLQEAVQQRRHQGLWESVYLVSGPLTWRQFHRLAGRGTEDQCEPQPIPSLLVGYDKDWLALSPFALKFWDKLMLEPYSHTRDVAYIVVAPDNDFILSHVRTYFRELSSVYELCKLGRHCPITKVLRDGIMRVGKSTAKNLADEPVDEWFNLIGDGPIASRLKLYAQACRYHLAPHLAQQSLDSRLLDGPAMMKPPDKPKPVASPRPPGPANENSEKDQAAVASGAAKSGDSENPSESSGSSTPGGGAGDTATSNPNPSSGPSDNSDSNDNQQIPTVVMYIVEPFTYGSVDYDVYRLASLGLLRSYSQMLQHLPEHIRNAVQLQLISLDSIMSLGRTEDSEKRRDRFKDLAFSVFSRCHQLMTHQSVAKSLTGFGPAAAQDVFLKGKNAQNSALSVLTSKPFALAPQKDKQTELGEMFGDRRERSSILFCTYCLTEDQRWLVASCTNDKGDILETCCISTEVPNRTRRKKASVRKLTLHKLLDFIVEVMSKCLHSWRLVISRLGRLGHLELRDWATLLSRKSLLRYSHQLRELCRQCAVLSPPDTPAILSACLVSLEPDSALRIMADQYTPDDHFRSSCNSCVLSTPEDASCTHILVFPTSATTQSSQATFQQEHIDPLAGPLGDDDIFQALNDDDITVSQDINDIFRWTESPTQSPGASPRRDSMSQPGSPSMVMNGRHSPFLPGGPNRGSGSLVMDSIEEPLQLLQQPLALGYYVSTAKTGPLPKWFWSACPHLQQICPVFLKSALLIHSPCLQQNSDDLLHTTTHSRNCHPLDSNLTTDVLRYVLEGYNALSWLALDPTTHDRRSCLPVHIQVLMQLYHSVEALI